MRIRRAEIEALQRHAREGYPHEVCGALLAPAASPNGLSVVQAVRLENRESDLPRVRYQIDPEELLRLHRAAAGAGLDVVGYYHSHPDHPARPSETDRRRAAETISDGVVHLVVGVARGVETTPTAWVFRESGQAFEPEPLEIVE